MRRERTSIHGVRRHLGYQLTRMPALPPTPDGLPRVGVRGDGFDYTHLNRGGADLFAGVIAAELAKTIPQMRPILIP